MCIIASVPRARVDEIKVPADVPRFGSRIAYASHFIVPASPELRDAIDGGTPMETDTWHPLRGFRLHEPASVHDIAVRLATLATQMREPEHPLHSDAWTQAEALKVTDLFHHASAADEAVVTHLDLTRTGKRRR